MPLQPRPDPPLPMSVSAAVRVFGSEVRVALIRYLRLHPGATQRQVSDALGLTQQLVSRNTYDLVQHGVLREDTETGGGGDRRVKYYRLDEQRMDALLAALSEYVGGRDERQ